jgi:predicted transcriptional regulator
MQSFQFEIDEQSACAARFISRVRRELVDAFLSEKNERGLTQNEIAERLGVNASMISRQLSGETNLTLRSVAELAWAMGYGDIAFKLQKAERDDRRNYASAATHVVSFGDLGAIGVEETTTVSSGPTTFLQGHTE